MTVLPIVQRELIEAARRRNTYWLRVGVAATGLFIGIWMMLISDFRTPSSIGRALFLPLTVIALIYCGGVGIFRTADCLSEEKREGTLGLLFLTDLKGYDIVLGKLVATSVNAAYGMMALVPILAIPLLMGGVGFEEFARVVLVAFNTMFFSLATGMLSSALCRDERKAMVLTAGVLAGFVFGPILLCALVEDSPWQNLGIGEIVAIPSPGFSAVFAIEDLRNGAAGAAKYFPISVLVIHLAAWTQLIVSSIVVPRVWQDQPVRTPRRDRGRRPSEGVQESGRSANHAAKRRRRLAINPVYWLVTRGWFKVAVLWGAFGLGAVIWAGGILFEPEDWLEEGFYIMTALIAHTLIRFWLATEACRQFSMDRQSGALELLLSTPLPPREILRGQWLGLRNQFAGPIALVLAFDLVFLLTKPDDAEWVALWLVGMFVFVVDVMTIGWLSMWLGLKCRRTSQATVLALVPVLLLPWILFALAALAIEFTVLRVVLPRFDFDLFGPLALYLFLSLGIDYVFWRFARQRLLTRFRDAATERWERRA